MRQKTKQNNSLFKLGGKFMGIDGVLFMSLVATIIVFAFILVVREPKILETSEKTKKEHSDNFKVKESIFEINDHSDDAFSIIIDKYTGVNYIVYTGFRAGGLSPRYNADGTLFINNNYDFKKE